MRRRPLALGPSLVGDVANQHEAVRAAALGVVQEQRSQRAPADVAVRPHVALLRVPLAELAGRHPLQRLGALRHVAGVRDLVDQHPGELVAPAAEELRQRLVDDLEAAAGRHQRDPDRRTLEHRAEALVELDPRPLPRPDVGQVVADADQVARPVARPVHGAADAHVAQLAVAAADGDRAVEAAVARGSARSTSPGAASRSRSTTMRQHALARRHQVLRVDAEDAVGLRRPASPRPARGRGRRSRSAPAAAPRRAAPRRAGAR